MVASCKDWRLRLLPFAGLGVIALDCSSGSGPGATNDAGARDGGSGGKEETTAWQRRRSDGCERRRGRFRRQCGNGWGHGSGGRRRRRWRKVAQVAQAVDGATPDGTMAMEDGGPSTEVSSADLAMERATAEVTVDSAIDGSPDDTAEAWDANAATVDAPHDQAADANQAADVRDVGLDRGAAVDLNGPRCAVVRVFCSKRPPQLRRLLCKHRRVLCGGQLRRHHL